MSVEVTLTFYYDKERHLVCKPYSIENLHKMALILNLNRHWFHKGKKNRAHYDIPIQRMVDMGMICKRVHKKDIVRIMRGEY